jgi:predicted nucleic acid-binding protein
MKQIIADAMVVIHFAKITLLEILCDHFRIAIPDEVYEETTRDSMQFPDARLIDEIIKKKKMKVIEVPRGMIKEIEKFGIMKGEAAAVAAFKQGKGEVIASDDEAVRRNSTILGLKLVGTLALVKLLFKKGYISSEKAIWSLEELKRIGWFEAGLIDRIIAEVKYG